MELFANHMLGTLQFDKSSKDYFLYDNADVHNTMSYIFIELLNMNSIDNFNKNAYLLRIRLVI